MRRDRLAGPSQIPLHMEKKIPVSPTNRTVVVTGIGATTPLGGDSASTWEGLIAGRSGVVPLASRTWAADLAVRIAAPVAVDPSEVLPRPLARKLDRSAQFALIAAREAWADAGFTAKAGEDASDRPRSASGTVIASGIGGVTTLLDQYDVLKEKGVRRVSPHTVPMLMPNGPSANVGLEVGARAGVHTPVCACASGAEAVGYAVEMIRSGRADVVVAGGTEAAIHPLPIAAFGNMMAMSKNNDDPEQAPPGRTTRAGTASCSARAPASWSWSRPSTPPRAAPGSTARSWARGCPSDAHHIAQPEPAGRGIAAALRAPARHAPTWSRREVVHLNAHATSTPQGDVAEIKALRKVLRRRPRPRRDLRDQVDDRSPARRRRRHRDGRHRARAAPPDGPADDQHRDLDPEVDAGRGRREPRKLPEGPIAALNNSFGFGGHNVVLAFRSV